MGVHYQNHESVLRQIQKDQLQPGTTHKREHVVLRPTATQFHTPVT